MTFVLVQRGSWQGVEADIELESSTAAAFFTAARDYCAETHRPMPEIAEPAGGLRTTAQTTEMRWAFDYGPHGMYAHSATAAERAQSDALYLKYNMSRVSTGRPVINGTHTTGFYFDVATAAFQTWLLANGHRYGLTRPLGDADPNHWRYTPGTATAALDVTSLDNGAAAPTRRQTMDWILYLLSYKATAARPNVYYRGWLGTGLMEDSQFSQDQANRASRQQGFAAIELTSDADVAAEVAVLKTHRTPTASGSADLTPVLQAIAAGEAQDAADLKQLLAAIGQVDENTLATFGLKRA